VPANINTIIMKVLDIRAYELKNKNIHIVTKLADNLPDITADINQLQQLFLNLILNAEYFMYEDHKKGTLTITTEHVKNTVKATVTDDGPGIEKEKLIHIFDPFYTTKEVGKGTGMGLTIAYRIVAGHHGTIHADSEPGKGTSFTINFPKIM
jgi:signal transduction histidine kinase